MVERDLALHKRKGDIESYTHGRLSSPRMFLISMLVFLAIAGFVIAILSRQIISAFYTNPGLNGLIFTVLAIGILLVFMQMIRLFREINWVNSFREGAEIKEPVLLAPMKALLSHNSTTSLSTLSMRSILDSIATRLDESRDISRYLIGLLVFLGLLGTFWGLLQTIGSIGETIRTLSPGDGSANSVLDSLKGGLSAPLSGMGTAFSSSLFGLSGSLVLGFLDLQAGRAQNRFYTELENWLSSVTDVSYDINTSGRIDSDVDEIQKLSEHIRILRETDGYSQRQMTKATTNLATGIAKLVKNMQTEQQIMQAHMSAQTNEQRKIQEILTRIAGYLDKNENHGTKS